VTILRYHIAFGIVEDPARVLSMQHAGLPQGGPILSPSLASFASDSPALRLNSAGWMRLPAEVMSTLRTHAALKDYCRRRIEKKASIFDRPLQDFLTGYLDVVEAEVRDHAPELPGGTSWDAALYGTADWFFSAFLPLPNAHLGLTEEEREKTGAERFIRFDVLFWTGTSLVAVTLERLSTQTPRQRREHARFAAMRPDITFVTIPIERNRARLQSYLPNVCEMFWHGLRYPLGPYRPEAFHWQPSPQLLSLSDER
jgi:hypothetical protein